MTAVQVRVAEMHELCVAALAAAGLTHEEAAIVADDYIETEAAGRVSHGLAGLDVAITNAKNRGQSEVLKDSSSMIVIEGHRDMGHIVYRRHLPQLAAKAKAEGVAVLAARNVSRIASPAVVARRLVAEGLASVTFEYGGQAFVAHPDHADPVVSTNPISFGFPYAGGPSPILDMATSERAYFFIKLAENLGNAIPASWARDKNGEPTTDPLKAHSLAALGGYKGFGLAFMIELLTGAMLGVPAGQKGTLGVRGILTIALDPGAFGSAREQIESEVSQIIADLSQASYPGFTSGQQLQAVEKSGMLSIEEATLTKIRNFAGVAG